VITLCSKQKIKKDLTFKLKESFVSLKLFMIEQTLWKRRLTSHEDNDVLHIISVGNINYDLVLGDRLEVCLDLPTQ